MSDLAWLHSVFPVSPATRELCQRVGSARFEIHKDKSWYRGWNKDSYTPGCIGEALVSHLCGLPWATDTSGADDGTDIGDCDVKTSHLEDVRMDGWLRRLRDSKHWAVEYALVVVQKDLSCARYVGWSSGVMLARAPTKDWGWGATCVLLERSLLPGLPPSLKPRSERTW